MASSIKHCAVSHPFNYLTTILIIMQARCMKKPLAALIITAALTAPLAGCATTDTSADTPKITVMGEVYPLAWIASQVGGDRIQTSQIVPATASAHGYELSPAQTDQIGKSSLVIYVKTLATAVDEAVEETKPASTIDVAAVIPTRPAVAHDHGEEEADHDHEAEGADNEGEEADHDHEAEGAGGIDPHMWLNPATMPTLVSAVAAQLSTVDPEGATTYAANATALNEKLSKLDADYASGLSSCTQKTVIVTHPAFGYLTDQYGLTQVGISGFDEDTEPSPARLAEVAETVKDNKASTIFFANTSNPKIAEVLANDLKLKTQVLSTLTAAPDGQDYLTLSEANLTALRDGLGCS